MFRQLEQLLDVHWKTASIIYSLNYHINTIDHPLRCTFLLISSNDFHFSLFSFLSIKLYKIYLEVFLQLFLISIYCLQVSLALFEPYRPISLIYFDLQMSCCNTFIILSAILFVSFDPHSYYYIIH